MMNQPPRVETGPHPTTPPFAAPAPPRAALRAKARWLARLGPVVSLAFVIALFAILRPRTFLTTDNFEYMLVQTVITATAALGMTMIIILGGIDLSIGSNVALCSVALAAMLIAGAPPAVAALGAVALGSLGGLVIGLFVTRLKLTPFIVTLGMMGALRGAAQGLAHESTITPKATWLNDVMQKIELPGGATLFPPGVWITLILTIALAATLRYTRFGRHIFAIGSNEQTARLCGVAVERTKLLTYVVALAFAGVAGVMQFSYIQQGDSTANGSLELAAIAAVVIGGGSLAGGEGSVFGAVLGAFFMTVVDTGCTKLGMPNWVQRIVTGGIIILAAWLDRQRSRGQS